MTGIMLPTWPGPRRLSPRLLTARNELSPAYVGADQRINRLGSKWSLFVVMPPMTYETSLDWMALETETQTCVLELVEPGVAFDLPGAPRVNGAAQAGASLITDGWTPHVYIPKRKWFSVEVDGLLYSYRTTAAVIADASGAATLPITPMLRRSPANDAALVVNPAKFEGFAQVPDGAFEVGEDGLVTGLTFTLTERR